MATTRISDTDHQTLRTLADQTGKQHHEIIHEALDTYQRETLLDQINAGFTRLRSQRAEWNSEMDGRKLWDNTLSDNLSE